MTGFLCHQSCADGSVTCDEVVHQCRGDAEDAHQKVTDSQIEDEEVGDCAHATILQYDETHQHISHYAQQEDEEVGQDVAGCHIQRVLIIGGKGNIGDVCGVISGGVDNSCCCLRS